MTPTTFKGIRRIDTIAHYETLVSTGTVTINDVVITYDPNYLYIVDESNYYTKSQIDSITQGLEGVSGSVTIATTDWSSNTATKTFTELGDYDCIEFYPATVTDKTNASNAEIFVSANGNTVTFTATTTLSVDITFNYFITRGKD